MGGKPPSLYDEGLPSLFANQDNCHLKAGGVDVKQHAIFVENLHLPLRYWIRSQGLKISGLRQRVDRQVVSGAVQYGPGLRWTKRS